MSNLIEHYKKVITPGFDRYYIPDINIEKAEIIFFLESGHDQEVIHSRPLAGESGINFSRELFGHETAYGLWDKKSEKTGFFESSPFPLQEKTYRKLFGISNYPINKDNINQILGFQELRTAVYENENLTAEVIKSRLFKDYCSRMDKVMEAKAIFVLCGLFAQRFFEAYKSLRGIDAEIDNEIILIDHPVNWHSGYAHYERYVQEILKSIKEKIDSVMD
jgi:hypothetical protein